MKIYEFLEELKILYLPYEEYAVFGSGPLAIKGIRECKGLDIIVTPELWTDLSGRFKVSQNSSGMWLIKRKNIEIYKEWSAPFDKKEDVTSLIDIAEMIENAGGVRFVRLEDVIAWKKTKGRKKDIKDLRMIEEYKKG